MSDEPTLEDRVAALEGKVVHIEEQIGAACNAEFYGEDGELHKCDLKQTMKGRRLHEGYHRYRDIWEEPSGE